MTATEYKEKVNKLLGEILKLTEEQLNSEKDRTMQELILQDIGHLRGRVGWVVDYDMGEKVTIDTPTRLHKGTLLHLAKKGPTYDVCSHCFFYNPDTNECADTKGFMETLYADCYNYGEYDDNWVWEAVE